MSWRTTEQANQDLDAIGLNGALDFGPQQSRRYLAGLIEKFELVASYPEAAPERQATRDLVRLMPHEAHHILYIVVDGDVIILRVLHHLQDWFKLL
jgi:toxin ParE1/3/4